MSRVISDDDVLQVKAMIIRLRSQVIDLQSDNDRLRAENAAMRVTAHGLIWCAQCGALCPRAKRWRKYCSYECNRMAYNDLRRRRYSEARDLGIPGRKAAAYRG